MVITVTGAHSTLITHRRNRGSAKIRSVDSKQGRPPETPPQNLSQIPVPGALWSKGSSGGGNCEAGIVKSYLGDSGDSQIEEHKKGQRDGAYQSPLDP